MIAGITVLDAAGPTSFDVTTDTYTGPTGNEPFQLVYGECCGAPADLSISLPFVSPTVPEPASLALLGSALFGVRAYPPPEPQVKNSDSPELPAAPSGAVFVCGAPGRHHCRDRRD